MNTVKIMPIEKKIISSVKVAIMFAEFGPYHASRIIALNNSLAIIGFSLIALRFSRTSASYQWIPADLDQLPVVTLSSSYRASLGDSLIIPFKFAKVLIEYNIKAVFLPSYSPLTNFLCFLIAKILGCKTILMCESWNQVNQSAAIKNIIKSVIIKMFDSALVGGRKHLEYVASYGMAENKIFTGYDVVDVDYYDRKASQARENYTRQFLSEHSLATSNTPSNCVDEKESSIEFPELPTSYFLSLGRFVKKKNLDSLVIAYSKYLNRCQSVDSICNSDVSHSQLFGFPASNSTITTTQSIRQCCSLVFVGEGYLETHLKQLAVSLNLIVRDANVNKTKSDSPEVVFYPFCQADVTPLFYANAHAFILPSTHEEWGLVVNEALSCGVPVLVSEAVGSHFDLVIDGVNGFVFKPNDTDGLSHLLSLIDSDPLLRKQLGLAGRQIIENWKPDLFGQQGTNALLKAIGKEL